MHKTASQFDKIIKESFHSTKKLISSRKYLNRNTDGQAVNRIDMDYVY